MASPRRAARRSSPPRRRPRPEPTPPASVPAKIALPPGRSIVFSVNGKTVRRTLGRDVPAGMKLSEFLREELGLTGVKVACGQGACGACTVLLDGRAVLSCMMLLAQADGHAVVTIEGLPADDPVIRAFAEQSAPGHGTALQCGFCTPGFVMTAKALLAENPAPTLEEVRQGLSGNLCRCGCYQGIAQAVLEAARRLREGGAA